MSPDLDTVLYTLARVIDDEKWYGQKNDTYHCYDMMKKLGYTELLKIGDKDRGLKLVRTLLLEKFTLSEVTEKIADSFGVKTPVFPMSDDKVTTRVYTDQGVLSFHEFWVVKRAHVTVTDVVYEGIETARPVQKALECMDQSRFVLIGPSNPVTSIRPIIGITEYKKKLQNKMVVGISPMIGEAPFSGPTGVLMQGLNYQTNCVGVAEMYKDFLDVFIIHTTDVMYKKKIEDMGITVHVQDIFFDSFEKKKALVKLVERITC